MHKTLITGLIASSLLLASLSSASAAGEMQKMRDGLTGRGSAPVATQQQDTLGQNNLPNLGAPYAEIQRFVRAAALNQGRSLIPVLKIGKSPKNRTQRRHTND